MTDVSDCAQKSVEQEPTLRRIAAEASGDWINRDSFQTQLHCTLQVQDIFLN